MREFGPVPGDPGKWDNEDLEDIRSIKKLHPELKHWGDLAIGLAFGYYSQNWLDISWAELAIRRNIEFLTYIYIRQNPQNMNFLHVMILN